MKQAYKWVFLVLLATYVTLAFTLPTNPETLQRLEVSQGQARLLNLTVVIPLSLVYLGALYGFMRIKDYAEKVKDSREGPHFETLARGLMVLAFSLPINSIVSSLTSYIRHAQPHMLSDISIIRQYLALALAFTAIALLARGAQGLFGTLKNASVNRQSFYAIIGPIVLACVYTWLILSQGAGTSDNQPYFMPDWVVITTIAIPYIYAWCIGSWAAVLLYKYHAKVKGVIYKRALDNLAKGIAGVILVSIFLQFLTTLSGLLNRLDLTPLLGVVYVLIALYALGYGLIAQGAKKLKQIEEV